MHWIKYCVRDCYLNDIVLCIRWVAKFKRQIHVADGTTFSLHFVHKYSHVFTSILICNGDQSLCLGVNSPETDRNKLSTFLAYVS